MATEQASGRDPACPPARSILTEHRPQGSLTSQRRPRLQEKGPVLAELCRCASFSLSLFPPLSPLPVHHWALQLLGLSLLMPVGLALMATEQAHTDLPPAVLGGRTYQLLYPGIAGWLMDIGPKTCPVGGAGRDPNDNRVSRSQLFPWGLPAQCPAWPGVMKGVRAWMRLGAE